MAEIEKTDSNGKTSSRLKKLASSSTWTSPFRGSNGRKNMIKEFQDSNSVSQLTVPKKYSQHQVLEEEKAKKAAAEKAAAQKAEASEKESESGDKVESNEDVDAEGDDTAVAVADVAEGDHADETSVADTERPLTESEKEALEKTEDKAEVKTDDTEAANGTKDAEAAEDHEEKKANVEGEEPADDDNIEQLVKETPIEIVTQPGAKYEPVEMPNQAVLDSLLAKPNLLNRYQELNETAIGSVSRSLDDPQKVIDLGSGLKLTQQQLLDIAAKRVAPVIANINEEVEKSRQEDAILFKREVDSKVALHQAKLDKDLEKHKGKLSKLKAKFDLDIASKLASIANSLAAATNAAVQFEENTKKEIETAKTEYEDREKKAVEQHEVDKETLIKNHDELTTTKKQALEDAKTGQETTTAAIEELQDKKTDLDNKNSELSTEIDELTEQLNERTKQLDELREKLLAEKEKVATHESTKEELNTAIINTKKGVEEKKSSHAKLAAEVGVLGAAVAAYTAKLTSLKSDKEKRSTRLTQAKETYSSWQKEKSDLAEKLAREHEQKRLEAIEAAETDRVKREIEEEKQKLEEEKKQYEEERVRLEKEAEERREEEEKKRQEEEEKFLAEEQQRKEEYEKKAEEEQKKREEERLKREEEEAAAEAKRKEEAEAAEAKRKAEEEEAEAKRKAEEEEKENARLEEIRLANDPEHQRILRIQKRDAERQKLLDEQTEKDRVYNERKKKEEDEFEALQKEIEELKLQRDARAEAEKAEAERLAQAKLDEIEKLKEEHDAKLGLYKQRLEFEALQKERLEEEVVNLRKIRELREEKARLSTQVHGDSDLQSIQKLIEERELEVTRLTKQIEYDDSELYKALNKESARPMNAPIESKAVSKTSRAVEPSTNIEAEKPEETSKSQSTGLLAGALAGVSLGVAGIAAGASAIGSGASKGATALSSTGATTAKAVTPSTPSKAVVPSKVDTPSKVSTPSEAAVSSKVDVSSKASTPSKSENFASSASRDRSGSLGRTKSLSRKLKGILGRSKEEKEAKDQVKSNNDGKTEVKAAAKTDTPATKVKSVDISKQPDGQIKTPVAADIASESSSEWYSQYEEVSDSEFEEHHGNPNYIEVSAEEAEKYLKKNRSLA